MEPGDFFGGLGAMPPRWLAPMAWANAATHVVASVAMVAWLAPGLTGADRAGGYCYAAANTWRWTAGWLTWHVAAASFVAVCCFLALWAARAALPLRVLAIAGALAATVGLIFDIVGQRAYIGMAVEMNTVLRLDSLVGALYSGVVGNGLYSIGILLLALAWARSSPTGVRALGFAAGGLGLALSPAAWASGVTPWPAAALTGILIPTVTAWSVAVARWAAREAARGMCGVEPGASET